MEHNLVFHISSPNIVHLLFEVVASYFGSVTWLLYFLFAA